MRTNGVLDLLIGFEPHYFHKHRHFAGGHHESTCVGDDTVIEIMGQVSQLSLCQGLGGVKQGDREFEPYVEHIVPVRQTLRLCRWHLHPRGQAGPSNAVPRPAAEFKAIAPCKLQCC